jgi:hypothetical protein
MSHPVALPAALKSLMGWLNINTHKPVTGIDAMTGEVIKAGFRVFCLIKIFLKLDLILSLKK